MMRRLAAALAALAFAAPLAASAGPADSAVGQVKTMIEEMKAQGKIDTSKSNWRVSLPKPEMARFDGEHQYMARVKTNKGEMLIRLRPDFAPMHVTSFIYLAELGFYDGLSFHRVIPGFMAQGGCPLGTGTGSPGYRFDGEYKAGAKHAKRGVLSTANTGRPNTDGSQFFITFKETPWLDGRHTVYGDVVEGMETLKAIEDVGSESGSTTEPVIMEKVSIEVR